MVVSEGAGSSNGTVWRVLASFAGGWHVGVCWKSRCHTRSFTARSEQVVDFHTEPRLPGTPEQRPSLRGASILPFRVSHGVAENRALPARRFTPRRPPDCGRVASRSPKIPWRPAAPGFPRSPRWMEIGCRIKSDVSNLGGGLRQITIAPPCAGTYVPGP